MLVVVAFAFISVSMSFCFFLFVKYITVLRFDLINQHEYILICKKNLFKHIMNLKLMIILNALNHHYLSFFKCFDNIKLCIQLKNCLIINFNSEINNCVKNWLMTVVDFLSIAFFQNVFILLTWSWDHENLKWKNCSVKLDFI